MLTVFLSLHFRMPSGPACYDGSTVVTYLLASSLTHYSYVLSQVNAVATSPSANFFSATENMVANLMGCQTDSSKYFLTQRLLKVHAFSCPDPPSLADSILTLGLHVVIVLGCIMLYFCVVW